MLSRVIERMIEHPRESLFLMVMLPLIGVLLAAFGFPWRAPRRHAGEAARVRRDARALGSAIDEGQRFKLVRNSEKTLQIELFGGDERRELRIRHGKFLG